MNLWKEGIDNYYYKNINIYKLNPKSVTMNELFGYVNVMTNEWADGIVANIVRKAVQDTTDNKKWIIFDGPVDALWIENLNTVLDDNKMLCLSNGQRIKLPQTFTLMFEVQDLAVASPATVSRCGMVYLDNKCLGWQATYNTWANIFCERERNEKGVTPAYITTFVDKLRTFFKDNVEFLRKECKEVIQSVDVNLIRSCLNLVDVIYAEFKEKA
ncbi:MAG: AAA family ATPase [Candidatus Thorarchaeota archaeon]